MTLDVQDIREVFISELEHEHFVIDKSGSKMIEIPGAHFLATEDSIFGTVNRDYVEQELEWYNSMSLNVNDIPGNIPKIWIDVADTNGFINSNYGWCIYSEANGLQYYNCLNELKTNPYSRRAVMIYTRPEMWTDYNKNGRSDFMCTNTVQYIFRENRLHAMVQMRSNDVWAGYRNDYAWQRHVLNTLAFQLQVESGNILWNAGSLHLYEKDFYLADNFLKTKEVSITKKEYRKKYPKSLYC